METCGYSQRRAGPAPRADGHRIADPQRVGRLGRRRAGPATRGRPSRRGPAARSLAELASRRWRPTWSCGSENPWLQTVSPGPFGGVFADGFSSRMAMPAAYRTAPGPRPTPVILATQCDRSMSRPAVACARDAPRRSVPIWTPESASRLREPSQVEPPKALALGCQGWMSGSEATDSGGDPGVPRSTPARAALSARG